MKKKTIKRNDFKTLKFICSMPLYIKWLYKQYAAMFLSLSLNKIKLLKIGLSEI
jgi:hypothetical protein